MMLRALSLLFCLLLGWVIYLQHNDSDPEIWIPFYYGSGMLLLTHALGKSGWVLPGLAALVCLPWSISLALGVVGKQELFDEEGREMFALLLLAILFGAIAFTERKKRNQVIAPI